MHRRVGSAGNKGAAYQNIVPPLPRGENTEGIIRGAVCTRPREEPPVGAAEAHGAWANSGLSDRRGRSKSTFIPGTEHHVPDNFVYPIRPYSCTVSTTQFRRKIRPGRTYVSGSSLDKNVSSRGGPALFIH